MADLWKAGREKESAPLILALLREEAAAADNSHAGLYGSLRWEEEETLDTALRQEGGILFYHPALLCEAFLTDSGRLLERYCALCQKAAAQKNGSAQKPGFFSGAGGGAGTKEQEAKARRTERSYRRILQKFCVPREEAVLDLDSFDYIPYMSSLDQGFLQVEPLEYREVSRLDELAIAIDTSGSCSGALVQRFLSETWSILRERENFFSRMRVHLIQCDCMIQDYRVLTSQKQWEELIPRYQIKGHGDTDFCPVFELLDELKAKKELRTLRALLYFTDGDGIYPEKEPWYETVFVFVDQESEKGSIPSWAVRVNLGELL